MSCAEFVLFRYLDLIIIDIRLLYIDQPSDVSTVDYYI